MPKYLELKLELDKFLKKSKLNSALAIQMQDRVIGITIVLSLYRIQHEINANGYVLANFDAIVDKLEPKNFNELRRLFGYLLIADIRELT